MTLREVVRSYLALRARYDLTTFLKVMRARYDLTTFLSH
jgi:hypothetical protein